MGDGWLLGIFLPVVVVGGGYGFAGFRRGGLLVVLASKKREREMARKIEKETKRKREKEGEINTQRVKLIIKN